MKKEYIYEDMWKAISQNNINKINELFNKGFDVDYVSSSKPLLLSKALVDKNYNLFETLLTNNVSPVLSGSDGLQIIHEIALCGDINAFNILKTFKRDVLKQDFEISPAFLAAMKHHTTLCKIFSQEGIDISVWINNLLYISVLRGEIENIIYFIEHGADVNYIQDNVSVLSAAIATGDSNIVKIVEDHGAFGFDIAVLDYVIKQEWFSVIQSNDKDLILHYIAKGCDKNTENQYGETAYRIAKEKGYETFLSMVE